MSYSFKIYHLKFKITKELWAVVDSNHRSRKTADLQSAPFGRSGNCPFLSSLVDKRCSKQGRSFFPVNFAAIATFKLYRAEEGSRTPDLLITNQLLYQLSYFGIVF